MFLGAPWKTSLVNLLHRNSSFYSRWQTDLISDNGDDHDDHIVLSDHVSAMIFLGERTMLVVSSFCSLSWCSLQTSLLGPGTAKRNFQETIWLRLGVWLRLDPPSDRAPSCSWSKLMTRQIFIFLNRHSCTNWEPSGKGTEILWAGISLHSLKASRTAWIFFCGRPYGKMEAGAEASPQEHPRRKPVLHGLEDQKRVS